MTPKSLTGGKRRGRGRKSGRRSRQNQNQNNQNQQGGNSSATAAAYGGIPPMTKYNGGALDGSDYNNNATVPLIAGNANVAGVSIPSMGGNSELSMKGGASIAGIPIPFTKGGNAELSIPMVKGGESIAGIHIPFTKGGSEHVPIKGGNVLNNLAVPAVLLYANNTFGKKRSSGKSTKNRRFRRNRGRRTNRRNR